MVNVSSPGWDTVIVSKRNRNEYDSPQSTRRTQSFNLLFIKMFKRKIFSVFSVSSVVNKTQNQYKMNVTDNLKQVLAELPSGVRLVAVSKFHPNEAIEEAYRAGQRIFGESKVQEMTGKYESLPKDIEWHFIGHLQTNKIKYMAPYVSMIHGIDSYKLLAEVNKQAIKAGRVIRCLLQIHIAQEETKFGFSFDECKEMLNADEWKALANIQICGLMGMATNTDSKEQIEREFRSLNCFFHEVKKQFFADEPTFCELSMGMSHDYHLAIAEGSTLVRVGSKIFGERVY